MNMNKFLKVLGGVFLAILVLITVGAMILIPKSLALDKDAVSYIEASIPHIVKEWNTEELRKRAAPQLLAQPGFEQLPKLFFQLSKLGKLEKLEKPIGRINTRFFSSNEFNGTWGDYTADAKFENGPAQFRILIFKSGESWQFVGFYVNSQALLSRGMNQTIITNAAQ